MLSVHPLADAVALTRWLIAFGAVAVAPGWVLVSRHLRGWDWPSRLYVAAASGVLSTALLSQALGALGWPTTPFTLVPAALLAGWGLGRSRTWRETAAGLADGVPPLTRWMSAAALLLCAIMGIVVLAAFRGYAAPNHLDDATNHAFMVWRIAESGSVSPARMFAPPFGLPAIPYLPGWHVTAALAATLAGVPAWASAWYLPVLAATAFPLATLLYYRTCGLSPAVVVLGAVFAAANYFTPTNIFAWGGFGAIIGTWLIPFVVLAARAVLLRPGRAAALTAGLSLGSLVYIHTSEVFVALLLLIPAWPRAQGRLDWPRIRPAVAGALVTALLVGALPLLPTVLVYGNWSAAEALKPPPGLGATAREFLTYAGGNVPILQWFVVPALVAGLLGRRERRLGLVALAMAALYFGLREWHDPVSLAAGRPFYRQAGRVIYPQAFLLPPLMASAVAMVLGPVGRHLPANGRRAGGALVAVLLAWFVLAPGAYWSYRNLEYQERFVPFSAADAQLAREMSRSLDPCAAVANQYGDGSYWAMHVSGLRFLDPCSWPLGEREGLCHRSAITRLLERPWPPEVIALRELGTDYVYVGDKVLDGVQPALTRARLAADSRFERLLDDGNAAVYRIRWDAEPAR